MKDLKGKTVALTGAASGIGQALAMGLAEEGCDLAISDVNRDGLDETVSMIQNTVKVTSHIVNTADGEEVNQYAKEVVDQHGKVDMVINNAGIANADPFEAIPYEDFKAVMDVNFWGVFHGCKAFLPYLKQRPEARIVNMSSINGVLPFPSQTAYVTSKFAVRGFSETLYLELKGSNVAVSSIHPGSVRSNMARDAKVTRPMYDKELTLKAYEGKMMKLSAEGAAKIIIKGIKKKKFRIVVGNDAKAAWILQRLFPQFAIEYMNWFYHRLHR